MALKLRTRSSEEQDTIEKLAYVRRGAARLVERARIILLAHQRARALAIAPHLGHWIISCLSRPAMSLAPICWSLAPGI
jgi:hypothetical protein